MRHAARLSGGGDVPDAKDREQVPDKESILRGALRLARENRMIIVLSIALLVFVYLLQNVMSGDIRRIDGIAYQFFVVRLRRDWLTPIMQSFTSLSAPVVLAVMLIVVAAFAPGRMPGRFAAANLVGIVALNYALKEIVQRPRPEGFRLIAETGYSFPSGHSMVAVAFYGFLIWLIIRYEEDRLQRWIWSLALFFVVIMIGISRVYLGVHYFSDVVAGYCVAAVWLVVFTRIIVPAFQPED
ncbi:MAG: phosphatase PAP2 family protein [Atopobiaceae bacterium]|nr:phosphatase PAP2 family protein [Atopobiaceae bacterium]